MNQRMTGRILALVLALFGGNNIMGLVSYAWAGFGAAFGPRRLFLSAAPSGTVRFIYLGSSTRTSPCAP